jgi:signal transduction histidine kinase
VPIAALHGEQYTSMVSVPMISEPAGLAGVLNVHTVAPREFDDRDVRLLLAIGRLLAGAVHQARMHRRLAGRERAHERFVEQTVAAQEAERRRLAGEIHDGISQRLVTLSYHLDAAVTLLDQHAPADARSEVETACDLVGLTLDEARAAIGALRPPVLDDLGLPGALAALARELPDVVTTLAVDDRRLPEHVEVALYRIAQEALQNVLKHAGADRVTVLLEVSDHDVRLAVADDGVGFDPGDHADARTSGAPGRAYDGYGLASARERAELIGGTVRLASHPGSGTTLTVRAPLPDTPEDSPNG